jgi:methyltransferase-like protein/ubiquinone/menaquinone biosynthesis C-methylase UbiE
MTTHYPFTYAHPAALQVVLRLLGPAPIEATRATILHIGCGTAPQLLSMAALMPEATFHGTDPDADHIATAQRHADALSLSNITLHQAPHAAAAAQFADLTFDYIIVQGLFDLLGDEERGQLLQGVQRILAPRGVAYVDYATYPGQHLQDPVRKLMQFAVSDDTTPEERLATAADALTFVGETAEYIEKSIYGAVLSVNAAQLHQQLERDPAARDTSVVRAAFEPRLRPLYFHQFATLCAAAGLRFFYEADFANTMPPGIDATLMGSLRVMSGGNMLRREQYIDFLSNRSLRRSMITHADVQSAQHVNPDHLRRLYFRSQAEPVLREDPDGDESEENVLPTTYKTPDGRAFAMPDAATSAALYALCYAAPDALSWRELLGAISSVLGIEGLSDEQSDALLDDLLGFYGNNTQLVQVVAWRPPLPAQLSDHPRAFPLAQVVYNDGPQVPNAWGDVVTLPPLVGLLLPYLDGENDLSALLKIMHGWVDAGYIQLQADASVVDEVLRRQLRALLGWLHDHALLVMG